MQDKTRNMLSKTMLVSATVFIVVMMVAGVAVADLGFPCAVKGVVTYNGQPVSGATVTGDGASSITNGSGGYKLDVHSGSTFTVTASYGNSQVSQSVTTPGNGGIVYANLAIPAPKVTPTPQPGQNNGGSSGSAGGQYTGTAATPTPTPAANTSTGIGTSAITPTPIPTPTSTPTPMPSATPAPGPVSFPWWLVLVALGIIAVAAAGYLFMKKQ